jgi:hypothetical protein
VSAQVVGILCGIFSIVAAAVIYWGGLSEQARASRQYAERLEQR